DDCSTGYYPGLRLHLCLERSVLAKYRHWWSKWHPILWHHLAAAGRLYWRQRAIRHAPEPGRARAGGPEYAGKRARAGGEHFPSHGKHHCALVAVEPDLHLAV